MFSLYSISVVSDRPASWPMQTRKQPEKMAAEIIFGKNVPPSPPIDPADPMPPEYWAALLRDVGAATGGPARRSRLANCRRSGVTCCASDARAAARSLKFRRPTPPASRVRSRPGRTSIRKVKGRRDHQQPLRAFNDEAERRSRRHPSEGDAANPQDAGRGRDLDDRARLRSLEAAAAAAR